MARFPSDLECTDTKRLNFVNLKVRCPYLNIIMRHTSPNVGVIVELFGH